MPKLYITALTLTHYRAMNVAVQDADTRGKDGSVRALFTVALGSDPTATLLQLHQYHAPSRVCYESYRAGWQSARGTLVKDLPWYQAGRKHAATFARACDEQWGARPLDLLLVRALLARRELLQVTTLREQVAQHLFECSCLDPLERFGGSAKSGIAQRLEVLDGYANAITAAQEAYSEVRGDYTRMCELVHVPTVRWRLDEDLESEIQRLQLESAVDY